MPSSSSARRQTSLRDVAELTLVALLALGLLATYRSVEALRASQERVHRELLETVADSTARMREAMHASERRQLELDRKLQIRVDALSEQAPEHDGH